MSMSKGQLLVLCLKWVIVIFYIMYRLGDIRNVFLPSNQWRIITFKYYYYHDYYYYYYYYYYTFESSLSDFT